MAWDKIGNLAVISLAIVFAACGGDSGNNASNDEVYLSTSAMFTYKTYEGLAAELPCRESLYMSVAHISSTNEDFICCPGNLSEEWFWQSYQNGKCITKNGIDFKESSSNTTNTEWSSSLAIGSSSSHKFISSCSVMISSSIDARSSSSIINFASSSGKKSKDGSYFLDSRDGQKYRAVKIGSQQWMAENLNFEVENSFCYNGLEAYCDKYGRLYQWSTIMDSAGLFNINGKGCGYKKDCTPIYPVQGICPVGWHVPTKDEFEELFSTVGGENIAGRLLKADGDWSDNGAGSDAYSFTTLPAGYFGWSSKEEGNEAFFWSSTKGDDNCVGYICAYSVNFSYNMDSVIVYTNFKSNLFSLRCINNIYEFIDSRDGQVYKAVLIGDQMWMSENLKYKSANSFCYREDSSNCDKFGRLYTWSAAMDSAENFSSSGKGCGYKTLCSQTSPVQGICPEGWHVPMQAEWEILFNTIGGMSIAGGKLKAKKGWAESGNGIDAYGFSALPAGSRPAFGNYENFVDNLNYSAAYWTSSENDEDGAYYVEFYYDEDEGRFNYLYKPFAFSVRCLRNEKK